MKKIITLKVLMPFYDKKCDDIKRQKNSEFECSKSRAIEILKHEQKLVEIIAIKNLMPDNGNKFNS